MVHVDGCPWIGVARCCAWCAGPMYDKKPDAVACSDRCRAGHWKWEQGYGHPDRRRQRANGRHKASGLQVSYRRAVDAVAAMLRTSYGEKTCNAEALAEHAVKAALSDRQRARLDARRT